MGMRLMLHLIESDFDLFDDEGHEVADLVAAHELALSAARDILSHEILTGTLTLNRRIDVTDETGRIVLSVPFTDVVTLGSA